MSFPTRMFLILVTSMLLIWISTTVTNAAVKTTKTSKAKCMDTTDFPFTSDDDKNDWRDNTLIYQIWPRSFQDSDGDGEGDLQGIIQRLDYLIDLGVDTIRLSAIYSSPCIDSGYDILNHTDINPVYGDFNDFSQLIQEAHSKDLKVILDIVPNHSSNQHSWFVSSVHNEEPYEDYYIWADGKIEDNKVVPPNNWKSTNDRDDGSAWTWNMQKKQWYYHKFHYTTADLNFRNEDVIQEILKIFDFWLEKGVDGFCICGVSYLYENVDLLDDSSENKKIKENSDNDSIEINDNIEKNDVNQKLMNHNDNYDYDDGDNSNDDYHHDSYIIGLSENAALMYRFREHINDWAIKNNQEPKLLIGELDKTDNKISQYYGNDTHSGIIPLNLIFITKLNKFSNARDVKKLIEDWLKDLPDNAKTNWMLSNQDSSRVTSRLDQNVLDGLYILTLLLPGQAMTYYGEEIGMLNRNTSWNDTLHVISVKDEKIHYIDYFENRMKTPMQWDNTTSAGFSTNSTTFLPVNLDYQEINVYKQIHDRDSNLEVYKKLAILRKNKIFTDGDYKIDAINDNIFILKRSLDNRTCIAIINFGLCKQTLNLSTLYSNFKEYVRVVVDSSNPNVQKENDKDNYYDIENDSFVLTASAAAVLCDKDVKELPLETVTDGNEDSAPTADDSSNDINVDFNKKNSVFNEKTDHEDTSDKDTNDENKLLNSTLPPEEYINSKSNFQNTINVRTFLFMMFIDLTLIFLLQEV